MALFGKPSPEDDARAEFWRRWMSTRDPFALASFVLGVFSLIEFGAVLIFGVAGAILGVMSLARLYGPRTAVVRPHGHYFALFGILTSVLSLIIAARFVYRWV